MKTCVSLLLFVLLICTQESIAQPRIRLVDSTKKAWIPEGKGTVGLRFRNAGNQPLIVTNAAIRSQASIFKLLTPITTPKIVNPGDTSFVTVEIDAKIAYEYFAYIDLVSNDPAKPLTSFSLRVNDSIPPQQARSLNAIPQKGGFIDVAWQTPNSPRDGDTVALYRVFVISKSNGSEEIYTGLGHGINTKSRFEGDVIVSVLTYDDMGNKSVTFDTTWIDGSKPRAQLTNVDQQFAGITEHVARGKQRLTFLIKDWHMQRLDAYWREPGSMNLQPLANFSTFTSEEEHSVYFDWNTSQLRGRKEIVLISRDKVDNTDTTVYSFQVTQINGWPKGMFNHHLASGTTILKDEGGRFLLTGSDIANGAFRPNGHHYYYQWPLDITRSLNDLVITATADLDHDTRPEVVALSQSDRIIVMNMHGKVMQSIGEVTFNERYASIVQTPDSSILLTGPAPIAVKASDGRYRMFGATQSFRTDGSNAELERAFTNDGIHEKDRFVAGDLNGDGSEEIVHVHDNGTWEELSIRTRDGKINEGPIPVWKPTASYKGFFPSLGDIDGDNDLEIVIPAPNDSIYVYHHTGVGVSGYPVFVKSSTSGRNQAMIVDLTGDGAGDIILSVSDSIVAFDGKQAKMISSSIWPIKREGPGSGLITIADFNSDGYLELIDPPAPGDTGWVHAFDLNVLHQAGTIEWGTFQHDMLRSGNYHTETKALQSSVRDNKEKVQGVVLDGKTLQFHQCGKLELCDILGRTILTRMIESEESIDLSHVPPGIYFVRMDELVVTKIAL